MDAVNCRVAITWVPSPRCTVFGFSSGGHECFYLYHKQSLTLSPTCNQPVNLHPISQISPTCTFSPTFHAAPHVKVNARKIIAYFSSTPRMSKRPRPVPGGLESDESYQEYSKGYKRLKNARFVRGRWEKAEAWTITVSHIYLSLLVMKMQFEKLTRYSLPVDSVGCLISRPERSFVVHRSARACCVITQVLRPHHPWTLCI